MPIKPFLVISTELIWEFHMDLQSLFGLLWLLWRVKFGRKSHSYK